jgi:hypothetical protein
VSPESADIFDLIIELHRACGGAWEKLLGQYDLDDVKEQLENFVQYAALFLNNMGNYYVLLPIPYPKPIELTNNRGKEIKRYYHVSLASLRNASHQRV